MNRVKLASKNINISILLMVVDGIASFIVRTIFINNMLVEQLGINSLFTDITTLISIADGGVGAAFASVLYKAFHDKDNDKVYAIYKELKKIYDIMTVIVVVLALAIYPFIRYGIGMDNVVEINSLYIIFMIKLILTYVNMSFYLLVWTDQKLYYYKKYCFIALVVRVVIQVLSILYFKSYTLYFAATAVYSVLPYILTRYKAMELYGLRNKRSSVLSREEKEILYKRIMSGMIVHIAYIIFNGTDYILISKFCGLGTTGIYSNYTMIVSMVTSVISSVFIVISSTIGDMLWDDDIDKTWANYRKVLFANIVLIVGVAISYLALFQPVIMLWAGEKFLLAEQEVWLIVLVFICGDNGFMKAIDTVRLSSGIYEKDKWFCLFAGILNVVLSYIWGLKNGLSGILLATIVSSFIYHVPGIIFTQKYIIKKSIYQFNIFWIRIFGKVFFSAIMALMVFKWCITNGRVSWMSLIGYYSVLVLVFATVSVVLLRKEKEFLYFYEIIKNKIV